MGGAPRRLLEILAGSPPRELLNLEFPTVRSRRPDLVARLENNRIFHMEMASGNEAALPWRMLEYYLLIHERHQAAPQQMVLYVGEAELTIPDGIHRKGLEFCYQVRDIREIDAARLLESEAPEDHVLALLCRAENPRTLVRDIVSRMVGLPRRKFDELRQKLMILSELRHWQELVREAVAVPVTIDLSKIPEAWEPIQRKLAAERAEGKAEGKAEGIREGTVEGESRILRRLLEARFGPLPEWVRTKLAEADSQTLERWSLRLLDRADLRDILD